MCGSLCHGYKLNIKRRQVWGRYARNCPSTPVSRRDLHDRRRRQHAAGRTQAEVARRDARLASPVR